MAGSTTFSDLRQRFPQYEDIDDARFVDAVYTRFYSDMDRAEFDRRLGWQKPQEQAVPRLPDFDRPEEESEIKREINARHVQQQADARNFAESAGEGANSGGLWGAVTNPAGFFGGGMMEIVDMSDEGAALSARARNFYDRVSGNDRAPLNPDMVAAAERERLATQRQERPIYQTVREVGAISPLAIAAAPATTTLLGTAAVSALEGAVIGAAQGFGAGESMSERVQGAQRGALFGGTVGAVAPPIIEGAGRAISAAGSTLVAPLGRYLQRRFAGESSAATPAQRAAFRETMSALEADGYSRKEAIGLLREFSEGGATEEMVYQLFPNASNFQRLVRGSASTRGPGQQTLIETIDANRTNQASNLADDFSTLMDPSVNFNQEYDRLVEQRARNAAPLYRQAFFDDPASTGGRTLNDAMAETAQSESGFVDQMIANALELRRAPAGGQTLAQFARSMGGISDARGDLRAIGGTNFGRGLIRNNGRSIDDIGEAAYEAGYFAERPTVNDVLDALDAEMRGTPLYSSSDMTEQGARESVEQSRRWLAENNIDITAPRDELERSIRAAFAPGEGASASFDDVVREATEATARENNIGLRTVPRSPELVSVIARARESGAMSDARRLSGTRGGRMTLAGDGDFAVIDLHHLRLGINDRIERATGNQRAYLMQLRNDLDAAMPAEYSAAREAYAADSTYLDAMRLGRAAIRRGDTEDMVARLEALTPEQRTFARIGAVRELRETIGRRGDRTNAARSIVDNPVSRERLRALFDSEAEFNDFVRAVERSDDLARVDTFLDPRIGTSMRHADANEGAARDLADGVVNMGVAGATGNAAGLPGAMLRTIANVARRRQSAQSTQEANRAIVDLATSRPNDPRLQELFDAEVRRSLGDGDYQRMLVAYRSMFPGGPSGGVVAPQITADRPQQR